VTDSRIHPSLTTHRPLRIGRLLGRSIAIYVRNLLPFTLLGVFFLVPWSTLVLWLDGRLSADQHPRRHLSANQSAAIHGLELASVPLLILLTFLLTGAVTYGVVQQLRGQPASFAQAMRKGLSSSARVLSTAFVCGLRVFVGGLLLIVPGIIQQVRLYVAIPAAEMEGTAGHASMERSRHLTRGSGWQIFCAWLMPYLLGIAFALLEMFCEQEIDPLHALGGRIPAWLNIAIALFVGPFSATLMATTYFLLRQGKENVDPDAIAAVFD
jgi:hypothetical protein